MKRNNTSHSSKQTQHQTIQSDIHTRKQGRPQPMPLFVHVLPLFWLLLLCLTCLLPDCFVLALLSFVVYSPQHAHNQHITHHYSLSPKHIIATAAALHAGCLWPVHMQSTSSGRDRYSCTITAGAGPPWPGVTWSIDVSISTPSPRFCSGCFRIHRARGRAL